MVSLFGSFWERARALALEARFSFRESNFGCGNELELWTDASAGKDVRKAFNKSPTHEGYIPGGYEQWEFVFPLLARGRASGMKGIRPIAWGICGGPWRDKKDFVVVISTPVFTFS